MYLIFIIEKGLYLAAVPNNVKSDFVTAKTQKFNKIEDINIQDLKLWPIINQIGTYIYNGCKVIANYLSFPDIVKKQIMR